jgi:hypothetical protein
MTTVTPQPVQPPQPGQPAQTPKSSGCWKALFIGCGVIVILGAIACAIMVFFVFGVIRSTSVYKNAHDKAINDPRVIAALGSPVATGFWVSGSVHEANGSGVATFKFPISGPKGKATVSVDATLENGSWVYQRLIVHPDSGPDIDVLQP